MQSTTLELIYTQGTFIAIIFIGLVLQKMITRPNKD